MRNEKQGLRFQLEREYGVHAGRCSLRPSLPFSEPNCAEPDVMSRGGACGEGGCFSHLLISRGSGGTDDSRRNCGVCHRDLGSL